MRGLRKARVGARWVWRLGVATACVAIAPALAATGASATEPLQSPLPGYPRFQGVILVDNGSATSAARESAVLSATAQETARARVAPQLSPFLTNEPTPNCTLPTTNPGSDLCWWGGPVVKAHTVHVIFWEGPSGHAISDAYVTTVDRYFEDVVKASGSLTNVYSVATQYGDKEGPGEYNVAFEASKDAYRDATRALPAPGAGATECTDPVVKTEPCITDNDLQQEITAVQLEKGWEASLSNLYFVFTPPKVGSCFYSNEEANKKEVANPCSFASDGYCGYHSHFGTELAPSLYADVPDDNEIEGCDSYEHPNGTSGADASIDVASREHNELITDPLGNGWHDRAGNEEAAKCGLPSEFEVIELIRGPRYLEPHGGEHPETKLEKVGMEEKVDIEKPGTYYNQHIGGGEYWLQTEWSNSASENGGGCEQQMLNTQFEVPAVANATVPVTFNGSQSQSGEPKDAITYWVWDFGDETQIGTPSSTISHVYAKPGDYTVTLTVYDQYGNSHAISKQLAVGPPPLTAPVTPTAPATPVVTTQTVTSVTTSAAPVTSADVPYYSSTQLAAQLVVPRAGTKLGGLGTISFGRAACPPACSLTARLYARVKSVSHGHHVTKNVLIGSVTLTVATGSSRAIALKLGSTGRALLRRAHSLSAQLQLVVTGAEGGSWQLSRAYTLTSAGGAARRR